MPELHHTNILFRMNLALFGANKVQISCTLQLERIAGLLSLYITLKTAQAKKTGFFYNSAPFVDKNVEGIENVN